MAQPLTPVQPAQTPPATPESVIAPATPASPTQLELVQGLVAGVTKDNKFVCQTIGISQQDALKFVALAQGYLLNQVFGGLPK